MQQSTPARCTQMIADSLAGRICGAPMQLVVKYPRVWSYQERISERCALNHIAHAQAVVEEPEPSEDSQDCWGAF